MKKLRLKIALVIAVLASLVWGLLVFAFILWLLRWCYLALKHHYLGQ